VVGIGLMGLELMLVDAAFYLLFIGFAACVVGLIAMVGIDLPIWGQYIAFAALAGLSVMGFREGLYRRLRGGSRSVEQTAKGRRVRVDRDLAPGQMGRAELQGTWWDAYNIGNELITSNEMATVVTTDGIALNIVRTDPYEPEKSEEQEEQGESMREDPRSQGHA